MLNKKQPKNKNPITSKYISFIVANNIRKKFEPINFILIIFRGS